MKKFMTTGSVSLLVEGAEEGVGEPGQEAVGWGWEAGKEESW